MTDVTYWITRSASGQGVNISITLKRTYREVCSRRADAYPYGIFGLLEQGQRSLVEPDDAVDGNVMILQVFELDLGNLRPDVGDPGIGDKDVKMIDAMRVKRLHGVSAVGEQGGIELEQHERGALGLGKVDKSFG